MLRTFAIAAASSALAVASVLLAGSAGAEPGPPPCGQLAFVCDMVPMMPELDHDIDLTQQHQTGTIDTENLPPADVCAMGCV